MKFYRLEMQTVKDVHLGYAFFTSRAEAEKSSRQFLADYADDTPSVEVEEIHIEPTRAGILSALSLYAAHPNNG